MTTAELLDHPAIVVLIGAVVSFLIIGTIVSVLSIPFLRIIWMPRYVVHGKATETGPSMQRKGD